MHEVKHHTALECSLVKTLAYFDIFSYPLTIDEIQRFLQVKCRAISELQFALDELTQQRAVYKYDEFYSLRSDVTLITNRRRSNHEALKYLPIAREKARLIFKFPFVRAVMASGSLSKNCMDEKSDIDFFIITSPGRVWTVRLFMTLYKKLFLRNSHKLFCINYYVDEDHLLLPDKNLFIATELITLIPFEGIESYKQLLLENDSWVKRFYPNFVSSSEADLKSRKRNRLKMFIEKVLTMFPLRWVDSMFMKRTHHRWSKLYRNAMSENDFNVAFKSQPYVSKAHPRNFQKQVTEQYDTQLRLYSKKLQIPLS